MSLILFIGLPLLWALTGKLLGAAVAATHFYSPRGKELGRKVGRWCAIVLPCAFLALMLSGVSGNAGRGFELFGSADAFGILCGAPLYAAAALGAYAGGVYVVRDLTVRR